MYKLARKIKKVNYYWYHHGVFTEEEQNLIDSRIENHDWDFFKFVQNIFDGDDSKYSISYDGKFMQYFPNTISIVYEDGGFDKKLLDQETFHMIDHSECENG